MSGRYDEKESTYSGQGIYTRVFARGHHAH